MWTYQIVSDSAGRRDLKRAEVAAPEPQPGEALVRIKASSLNYRDLGVLAGKYPGPLLDHLVPLSDGAGEVVAVGNGVTRFKTGDRVMGTFFQDWISGPLAPGAVPSQLGGSRHGMLRELAALPEQGLVGVPPSLSLEEAATLPCAGVTAWNALVSHGRLKVGDHVLTLGTGGVSIFALQFARALGARVIVTSSSNDKLKRAKDLGAWATINYKDMPEWDKEARRLTDGRGADHVVEVGGAGTLSRSLAAAALGGRVSVIGVLSGGKSEVNIAPFIFSQLTVQGIYVGSRKMFEHMNAAIEHFHVKPVIDRVFAHTEAPAAFEHLRSGQHFGKIVIRH